MHPEARRAAEAKNPAVMAAITALTRWPDREMARGFVEGFAIVGDVASSGLFRQLGAEEVGARREGDLARGRSC
eukprot:12686032-Alexandrium_andersonii.AAC.1